VIAPDPEHRRVPHAVVHDRREIGRSAADVNHRDAEFPLLRRQDRFAGGQGLEDQIHHLEPRPVDGADDVLGRGDGAGDDVHLDLQARPEHADWILDPFLIVDREPPRQDVQDLSVHRDRHGFRRLDDSLDVGRGHFAVLDRDHPSAVEPLDVRPGNSGIDRVDLHPRHQLGLLHRLLDRFDRALDVDHDALPQPP
jgi:hypothetical protein